MHRLRPKLSTALFLLLISAGILPLTFALVAAWIPLREQLKLWSVPSVERALDASLTANRGALYAARRRLERQVRTEAVVLPQILAARTDSERAAILDAVLERQGVDLVQVWVDREGTMACIASRGSNGAVEATGTLSWPTQPREAVGPPRPTWVQLGDGVLDWFGAPTFQDIEGRRAALVLAVSVGAGYFQKTERATAGLSFYRRLEEVGGLLRTAYLLLFGLTSIGALALSLLLARRMAKGVSEPVEALVLGMNALGRGEAIDLKLTARFPEIQTLADAFRAMGATLRQYEERVREAEHVRATQETARFVAHEIRNSLTPVRTAIGVLERRVSELAEPERERAKRALGLIEQEAQRMTRLATTFSEYAHLPTPSPEPLSLETVVRRLAEGDLPREIVTDLRLDPSTPSVLADRDALERAIRNLLKNAVEAMPGGGRLSIELRESGGGALLRITDTGSGMDETTLRQAMQPGFTTKSNGTGLGLAMVRRTMSSYGGVLRVESSPGLGTSCELWLPAEKEFTSGSPDTDRG